MDIVLVILGFKFNDEEAAKVNEAKKIQKWVSYKALCSIPPTIGPFLRLFQIDGVEGARNRPFSL